MTLALLLYICSQSPMIAQEKEMIAVNGSLELAVTSANYLHPRIVDNIAATVGVITAEHIGLNELDYPDINTYFGWNSLNLGFLGIEPKIALLAKTTAYETSIKAGISDQSIVHKMNGYGFIELTTDGKLLGLDVLYGTNLGNGFAGQILLSNQTDFQKSYTYTELQLNKNLCYGVSIFGRIETPNFQPTKSTYLLGISKKI